MTIGWFRVRFDKGGAAAGLTGVTPHTLRHTAGSLALQLGASVVTVQKLLGHRNATTTMNVYSHMLPDDFDNLAEAMDTASRNAVKAGRAVGQTSKEREEKDRAIRACFGHVGKVSPQLRRYAGAAKR